MTRSAVRGKFASAPSATRHDWHRAARRRRPRAQPGSCGHGTRATPELHWHGAVRTSEAAPPAVGPTETTVRARAAGATRRRMHISAPPASLIDMSLPSQWTVDGSSRNSEQAPGVESKRCLPSTPSRFNTLARRFSDHAMISDDSDHDDHGPAAAGGGIRRTPLAELPSIRVRAMPGPARSLSDNLNPVPSRRSRFQLEGTWHSGWRPGQAEFKLLES